MSEYSSSRATSKSKVSTARSKGTAHHAAVGLDVTCGGAGGDEVAPPLRVTVFRGGDTFEDKFTCADHHVVLPWVVMATKHKLRVAVWDTLLNKMVASLHLLDLLSFQQPHPTAAGGTWSESLTGRFVRVAFLDTATLLWDRHRLTSRRLPPGGSCPTHFGVACPSSDDAQSHGAHPVSAGRDIMLLLVLERVAMIVNIGSGSIAHVLTSHHVGNRQFSLVQLLALTSLNDPICLLGCNDGCIVSWRPMAAELSPASVMITPHSSRITALEVLYFLPSPSQLPAALEREAVAAGPCSLRGAHLAVVIGTEGGSVTKLRFTMLDEVEPDFVTKKIHDSALSLCISPLMEATRHCSQTTQLHEMATSEHREALSEMSRSRVICSLGPTSIVAQDGETGAELRRIVVKGFSFRQLLAAPHYIVGVTSAGRMFRIEWSLMAESLPTQLVDVRNLIQDSQHPQPVSRFVATSHVYSVSLSATGISTRTTAAEDDEELKGLRLYGIHSPQCQSGLAILACTNRGMLLLDSTAAAKPEVFVLNHVQEQGADVPKEHFAILNRRTGILVALKVPCHGDHLAFCLAPQVLLPVTSQVATHQPDAIFARPLPAPQSADVERIVAFEPSGSRKATHVVPSPCGNLLAVVCDDRQLHLLDVHRGFTELTVPTMPPVDSMAWATTSTAFAIFAQDSLRVCVIRIRHRPHTDSHPDAAPRHQVHPSVQEVSLPNAPVAISGGRWLCVHFATSFSGITSQFFPWEAPAENRGELTGPLGNSFPQPLHAHWDRTGTLCALAYPGSVVFMEVRRKVFSFYASIDLPSPPLDILFHQRALFVALDQDILLLLPIRGMVQTILVASADPAKASSVGKGFHDGAVAGLLTYRVGSRPLGRLRLLRVISDLVNGRSEPSNRQQCVVTLLVADPNDLVVAIPLTNSVAQLLLCIHGYNFNFSSEWERGVVDDVLGNGDGGDDGTSRGLAGSVFGDSVLQFMRQCGFQIAELQSQGASFANLTIRASPHTMHVDMLVASEQSGDSRSVLAQRAAFIKALIRDAFASPTHGTLLTAEEASAEAIRIVEAMLHREDAPERRHALEEVLFRLSMGQLW